MAEIKTMKINDLKVTLIPGVEKDDRNIKGWDMFPREYPNVMLWAKKHSGKTVCVFNILKQRVDKDTMLIFFVPTIYNDKGWKAIIKYFKRKGNPIQIYTVIKEDGIDQLEPIVKALQEEAKERAEEEDAPIEEKERQVLKFDSESDSEEEKPRKKKYKTPKFCFVFDDISDELRSPSLVSLIKKNRHFEAMTILSSRT